MYATKHHHKTSIGTKFMTVCRWTLYIGMTTLVLWVFHNIMFALEGMGAL